MRKPDALRQSIVRELSPSGPVEHFFIDRIFDLITEYDGALPPGSLKVDPAERTRDEIVEPLSSALGQLRALQTHRAMGSSGDG